MDQDTDSLKNCMFSVDTGLFMAAVGLWAVCLIRSTEAMIADQQQVRVIFCQTLIE